MIKRFWSRPLLLGGIAVAAGWVASAPAQAGLMIDPIYGTGVTADMQNEIGAAISLDQSIFAQTANNTVTILFEGTDLGGNAIGESFDSYLITSYATYTAALGTAAATTHDAVVQTAVGNLNTGNGSAAAGGGAGTNVEDTAADFRMLTADGANLGCTGTACNGQFDDSGNKVGSATGSVDTVIELNTNATNPVDYNRSDNFTSGKFDGQRVIEHEIDEALGIGGAGSQLPGNTSQTGTLGALDLFRYSAAALASLNTNPNKNAYFSIDGGTTDIANFNQGFTNCITGNTCGDFGDWADTSGGPSPGTPNLNQGPNGCGFGFVQDAFSCPKQNADISFNSPEGIALQAIGYDPVPEPGTLALLAGSLLGFGLMRRRRA
jgi:hypothetical protein